MKYIRTKEFVWEFIGPAEIEYQGEVCFYKHGNKYKRISYLSIIKEADTIEELCDEFVGISDGKPQILRFVPYACAQYWNGGVYGAVWTDKGLIYVSKMNEEGELELL